VGLIEFTHQATIERGLASIHEVAVRQYPDMSHSYPDDPVHRMLSVGMDDGTTR
jgi:hypothetical protein